MEVNFEDMEMEVDSAEENENPRAATSEVKVNSRKVKEGCFLLGSPTFVDLGNGRWRCEETGHDLPTKEKESYARNKACRLALIDAALAKEKPPLNTFKLHPLFKSKLVCSLTGDEINKSEEHIWKHINGRRFLKKLEEKEVEMVSLPEKVKNIKKERKKLKAFSIHKSKNLEADMNGSLAREPATEISDVEEHSFWAPPIGECWDFDDDRDTSDQETEVDKNNAAEAMELSMCTKRMVIAMGPNSFATRKKKIKI